MRNHKKSTSAVLAVSLLMSACSTKPVADVTPVTPVAAETPAPALADTDTVESLTKDVDGLTRQVIQYNGPLTPKQENEVDDLKKQIHTKEMKKANLELKKMLGELQEEE